MRVSKTENVMINAHTTHIARTAELTELTIRTEKGFSDDEFGATSFGGIGFLMPLIKPSTRLDSR